MKRLFLTTAIAFVFAAPQAHALELFGKTVGGEWHSQRFRSLDKNNDGKVTQEEFVADQITQFKSMDADKSGGLSPDEVDFPPGTPDAVKATMRKQMQDQEKRQADDMARMKADMEKSQKESQERMKEEQEKAAKTAKDAPKAEPAKVEPAKAAPAAEAKAEVKAEAKKPAMAVAPAKTVKTEEAPEPSADE